MKTELNKSATIKDSEVTLFRNMSTILSSKYHVTFVGETHQQYVTYHSPQIGREATREISDIWIIAFSPSKNLARMTFLQAKYHRGILDATNRTFDGEYFQYELLSTRPNLIKVSGRRFNFPLNILSLGCCNSVGSYGIFYIDGKKQIDMAYSSAHEVHLLSRLPHSYASYKVKLDIPVFPLPVAPRKCKCGTCEELVASFDLDEFIHYLLDLKIGVELTIDPQHFSFIRSVLAQQQPSPAIGQFLDFIDNFGTANTIDQEFIFEGLPTNLMVINTDPKEDVRE